MDNFYLLTLFDVTVLRLQWGTKRFSKKLPLTMEVQKLKVLIHRLFELDSSELNFFSYSPKVCTSYVIRKNYYS